MQRQELQHPTPQLHPRRRLLAQRAQLLHCPLLLLGRRPASRPASSTSRPLALFLPLAVFASLACWPSGRSGCRRLLERLPQLGHLALQRIVAQPLSWQKQKRGEGQAGFNTRPREHRSLAGQQASKHVQQRATHIKCIFR